MSVEIESVTNNVLTIKVRGKLIQSELAAAQKSAGEIIQRLGKARLLVITENFEGWERGGDWGDVSFSARYDPLIERIAVVGDKQWEDLTVLFTSKGIRHVEIEYFETDKLAQARAWVAAATPAK